MITSGSIYETFHKAPECKDKDSSVISPLIKQNSIEKKDSYEVLKHIKRKLEKYDLNKELDLSSESIRILEDVNELEFNIFDLSRETNYNELVVLATYLMYKNDMFVNLTIEPKTFSIFIKSIQEGYNDVAYHNKVHGMDVGRLAYYYATS